MTIAEETEVTAVHAPGTEVTAYAAPARVVEEYRPRFVMSPEEAGALDEQLRQCMRAVLKENVDFGTVPGMGTKPSLFKPGAEKLIQWFGYGFVNERIETERDADGSRLGVTYRCTVSKELGDGRKVTIATCEGYAGYDEDRYYTSAEAARAKAKANEEKWARKDDRPPKPEKWENAAEYRAPWNTVLKMAQKRSLVGAAIDATAAAGLFTQDLEDMKGSGSEEASGSAFTEAAMASVMALSEETRNELDRWYRAKRWPDPARWSAEQWCLALQAAGYLTRKAEGSAQPASQRQPAPASVVPEGLDAGDPWLMRIFDIATSEEGGPVLEEMQAAFRNNPGDDKRAALLFTAWENRMRQFGGTGRAAA